MPRLTRLRAAAPRSPAAAVTPKRRISQDIVNFMNFTSARGS
jgi:hypothetical protein